MGKKTSRILMTLMFAILLSLTACGEKSEESVLKSLNKKVDALDGYKMKAEMKMNTGREEQSYNVDVWFKKDDYYRVGLENERDEDGQIILKNDDGVFVLTPALNKSFKFQTDWPESSSQPYLLHSLVNDIVKDTEKTLTEDESHYIFSTKTNYQGNNHLPYQDIYLDKKSYLPKVVKVMDKDKDVLIEVMFTDFSENPAFAEGDFNKEIILKDALASLPVINDELEQEEVSVMYPNTTLGAELTEKKDVTLDEGERVIMTFKGDKSFTLIQEKQFTQEASVSEDIKTGEPVNIGHRVGSLSGNSLEWTQDGVEFHLASDVMTVDELIEVAASVGQELEK